MKSFRSRGGFLYRVPDKYFSDCTGFDEEQTRYHQGASGGRGVFPGW